MRRRVQGPGGEAPPPSSPPALPAPREGRILRIKRGYNPNSSSIGSIIFSLPAALLGLTAAFSAAAGLIFSVIARERGRGPGPPAEPPRSDTEAE